MTKDATQLWQEKLDYLRTEEAKCADAAQKFKLQQDIKEAEAKLRELNAGKLDHGHRFSYSDRQSTNRQISDREMRNQPSSETAHIGRTPQVTIEPTEMRNGKPVIRYFVSYARDDKSLKDNLLKPLKQQLAIAKDYCFEVWDDGEILAGERWHEQIQAAVAHCQFGLLLVSPAFLSNQYIKDHELPTFVANNSAASEPKKRAIPVALKPIPFDNSIDLKGLEHLQIFYDSSRKTFQECSSSRTRDRFALELFQHILKIVKRYGAHPQLTESKHGGEAGSKDHQDRIDVTPSPNPQVSNRETLSVSIEAFIQEVSNKPGAFIISHRTAILQWVNLQDTLRNFTRLLQYYASVPKKGPRPILIFILDFGLHDLHAVALEKAYWNYQIFRAAIQTVAFTPVDGGLLKSVLPPDQPKSHSNLLKAWEQLTRRVCVIVGGLSEFININCPSSSKNPTSILVQPGPIALNYEPTNIFNFDFGYDGILPIVPPREHTWFKDNKIKNILEQSTNMHNNPEPQIDEEGNLIPVNDKYNGGGFGLYVTVAVKNSVKRITKLHFKENLELTYWALVDKTILDKILNGKTSEISNQDKNRALIKPVQMHHPIGPAEEHTNEAMCCVYLAAHYYLESNRNNLPEIFKEAYNKIRSLHFDILTLPEFITYPRVYFNFNQDQHTSSK